MADGVFNEDGTMLSGHWGAHHMALHNIGHGPPGLRTVLWLGLCCADEHIAMLETELEQAG
jgi:hypothetical protein